MCGRYNFSKESSSEMVQAVLEDLQRRQIEVKIGEVFPGEMLLQLSPAIASWSLRHSV